MSFRRRLLARLLVFAAAAGALGVLAFGARRTHRVVLPAVEAEQAAALCARAGVPLADFWERAKAMGVDTVVLRQRPLARFIERGEALRFSPSEVERWRAMGLIAPGAAVRTAGVWVKDGALFEQILDAAAQRGLAVSTSAAGGFSIVEFPPGADEAALGVYDPALIASVDGRGLAEVYAGTERLGAVGLRWQPDGTVKGFPAAEGPADLVADARHLDVDANLDALLRAAYGRPRRLLIFSLAPNRGVDENFELMRAALRELGRRGAPVGLPARAPASPTPPSRAQALLIEALLWLFGVLGPLLAARAGLVALRRSRGLIKERWSDAEPVGQLAAGLLAAAGVAAVMGAAARACFDSLPAPVSTDDWAGAALVGPLAIAALTLYTIDPSRWAQSLRRPVRYATVLCAGAIVLGAAFLIWPRALLEAAGLSAWTDRAEDLPPALWWAAWRWREFLIGFPCLLHALFLINWRLDCPDCGQEKGPWADPRGWFILGLLGPIGIVATLGRGGVPPGLALYHSVVALAAGAALGALTIAVRLRLARRPGPKDPPANRTIVPDP